MKASKLAKESGIFDFAREIGPWGEYKVYEAKAKVPICVGLPQYILEKGKDVRWATPEEIIQLMNIFCV